MDAENEARLFKVKIFVWFISSRAHCNESRAHPTSIHTQVLSLAYYVYLLTISLYSIHELTDT